MMKMTCKEFKRVMTELAEIDMNDMGFEYICSMLMNYFFESSKDFEKLNCYNASKFETKRADALFRYLDECGYYDRIEVIK